MPEIDMRAITAKAEELEYDVVRVQRELKRIASVKCRLKYMPGKSTFNADMTKALQEEQLLKSVKTFINGPRKNVSTLTDTEISCLTLDETMRALKCIQSKKTHTKWLTTEPGNNDDYHEACRIEQALKARRDALEPRSNNYISQVELQKLLDSLKLHNDLNTADCIARLEKFIKED